MADISEIILPNNAVYNIKDAYTRLQFSSNGNANRANSILYGKVDDTSTATAYTATIEGLDELVDGTTIMLHNGVVTSASGFTVNINNLGAKPCYNNMTNATQETTIFNIAYTMLFVYSTDLNDGDGGWWIYRGYDANTNTIGYQVRTNSSNKVASDTGYKYRLWLTSADGSKWIPINTSSSTNATTVRTLNTRPIDPFGPIVYRATNGTCSAGSGIGATGIWQQYTVTIGYSYMASGFSLSFPDSVYLRCTPQADGSAVMQDIVQTLPTTKDGKIYIHLGTAYSATAMELQIEHPVYWYDGTGIRLWTGVAIPTKTSDLTNDSGFITSSDIPEGSAASTTTPKMDGTAATGTEMAFARGDHVHPTDTSRQATLVSGTNIKTVMGESVLGSGNIALPTASTNTLGGVKIDGTSITISNGVISSSYTETDPTVPAWAKASTKPTYSASEVGALPATTVIPTKVSDLTNDSGFISSYTETDPTVPSWAKAANKPTYTYSEVGAAAASHEHSAADITSGILSISHGGTGESTATEAWTALGGGDIGKKNTLSASDIPSLNYLPLSGGTLTGDLTTSGDITDGSGNTLSDIADSIPPEMSVLSYGYSTWDDFISAYNSHSVVYCRASSNSNPASGSQTRMAFMAYVNNGDNPTNVEFQYYRSVSTHSASQQGDQVYIYKLDKTAGWSVTVREAKIKIATGTGLTQSFASNTLTLSREDELPAVTASDNGKILTVSSGEWAAVTPGASVSGVKGDAESTYRTGNVNLTPANLGITDFIGATYSTAGAGGLVPAPSAQQQKALLLGDGSWHVPATSVSANASDDTLTVNLLDSPNSAIATFTLWPATESQPGLMSTENVVKLNGKVDKTGDTITGKLIFKENNLDITNTPASNIYNGAIDFVDTNEKQFGNITRVSQSDGYYGISIGVYDSDSNISNSLSLLLNDEGTKKISVEPSIWRSALGIGTIGTKNTLTASDIPNIAASKINSGTLPVTYGGTGKTTATEAWTALGGGAIGKKATLSSADIPNLAASKITSGTLGIAYGGTGKTTATEAWTALGGGAIGKKASLTASDLPTVPITKGGTGATTTANAQKALMGTADTDWAYLKGSANVTQYSRWRCKSGIVFVELYYTANAGLSTTGKSFGTIPTGYRPNKEVEVAAYLGGNVLHFATMWVDTGGNVIAKTADGTSNTIYCSLSYPL